MDKKFNFIIVPTDAREEPKREEPKVERCCGTCKKRHKVTELNGDYTGINICTRLLKAVKDHYGCTCPNWETQESDPDVQDVEVRVMKDDDDAVNTVFRKKGCKHWMWISTIYTSGDIEVTGKDNIRCFVTYVT